jgi:hypothetical protein
MVKEPNKREQAAIDALVKLSKTWPDSLMLFSNSGTLEVLRYSDYNKNNACQELATIDIHNDGGDRDTFLE